MLFSCLVDADFITTEAFYAAAEGTTVGRGNQFGPADLLARLHRFEAERAADTSALNTLRSEIRAHAVAKASLPPGPFTLTVLPTGGGKTLTSLSFALEHAVHHGLRRVVYVIPYTSIIEQTADVFRKAVGTPNAVLEHHASFDWEGAASSLEWEGGQGRDAIARLRRAAENWDAPLVVTTAVQFFESLFAARTSRCRKLHNLAQSVIVLDEAQSLPLALAPPLLGRSGRTGDEAMAPASCFAPQHSRRCAAPRTGSRPGWTCRRTASWRQTRPPSTPSCVGNGSSGCRHRCTMRSLPNDSPSNPACCASSTVAAMHGTSTV